MPHSQRLNRVDHNETNVEFEKDWWDCSLKQCSLILRLSKAGLKFLSFLLKYFIIISLSWIHSYKVNFINQECYQLAFPHFTNATIIEIHSDGPMSPQDSEMTPYWKWLFIICSYVFIYVHYNLMVLVMDAFYFISYSSNELLKIMSSVMIF